MVGVGELLIPSGLMPSTPMTMTRLALGVGSAASWLQPILSAVIIVRVQKKDTRFCYAAKLKVSILSWGKNRERLLQLSK